jgi:Polysaccharide deacetylase
VNDVVVTLDVDWAPDFVVDAVADRLAARGVRATWFVTHTSPAIDRLRERADLFELGVHPNFLQGSTHGKTVDEVIAHVLELVPDAKSVRSHGLVQSGALIGTYATRTRLRVDASTFLPGHANLAPVVQWRDGVGFTRVPFYWSDDHELEKPEPCWEAEPTLAVPGLKVLNFHPLHVYLDLGDPGPYERLKAAAPALRDAPRDLVDGLRREGAGVGTLFDDVLDELSRGGPAPLVQELAVKP